MTTDRASIVAWLRREAAGLKTLAPLAVQLADAIEHGADLIDDVPVARHPVMRISLSEADDIAGACGAPYRSGP